MTRTSILRRLTTPIVGAPMAGGVSTPLLASAVSDSGGLGMLAAGYRTPEQLAADLVHSRDLTSAPFGVNLFVPGSPDRESLEPAVQAFRDSLAPLAARLGTDPGHTAWGDTDHWADKVLLVETLAPAVVSCTFGLPDADTMVRWRTAGIEVHLTATSPEEAVAALALEPDALILQGHEAGGHRATHDVRTDPVLIDHLGLLETVAPHTDVPLVAAGGVMTSGDVRRALDAGATAVQVGTALLLATESGANRTYRSALRDPGLTERVTTRAFTGRVAGAVRNDFVDRHGPDAPHAFPVVDQLTKPLRRAAAEVGDIQNIHIWAGSGWRACQDAPAAQIVRGLTP